MEFEVFKWLVAGASLVGIVLNIRKDRRCFAVWLATNVSWAAIDVWHGLWSQSALQAVYAGLAAWGWMRWAKRKTPLE